MRAWLNIRRSAYGPVMTATGRTCRTAYWCRIKSIGFRIIIRNPLQSLPWTVSAHLDDGPIDNRYRM